LVTTKLGIKNYLQVQKTLQEQAAAKTWAGQALTSLKSPRVPSSGGTFHPQTLLLAQSD
jgi:hypothetical protein